MRQLCLYKKYFSERGLVLSTSPKLQLSEDTKLRLNTIEEKVDNSGLQLNVHSLSDPKTVGQILEQNKQNHFSEDLNKAGIQLGDPTKDYNEVKLGLKNSKLSKYFDMIMNQIKSFSDTVSRLLGNKEESKTEFQASLKLFIYGIVFIVVGILGGAIGSAVSESYIPAPNFYLREASGGVFSWLQNIIAYICKYFEKFNIIIGVTLMVIGGAGMIMSALKEKEVV